ncbi:hydroxymethylglutaryl-CoA synthase [Lentilactobacillus farraginis DSM 18382 = JCM 14108]|uniref:Hydroxymethylglutaryl-CoA synthase n=1 Tax=Lentilactobacillus farraginis DSM 18382 = JCM 14108 TaxID=1423743 RepID=X0PEN6_9LACO|nr:hydroxymethylglutaryl-CoA synthase [Lentilactobacillus farraginis DSM 18382 = JCM 14108]
MAIGIDKIGFFTSPYYLDIVDLAHARNEEPNKFLIGIGQKNSRLSHRHKTLSPWQPMQLKKF